jgi:hypothetical protein
MLASMRFDHPGRDDMLRLSTSIVTFVLVAFTLNLSANADPMYLSIWGTAGTNDPVYKSIDVTNGFTGMSIALPAEALVKSFDATGHEIYTPISNPFGDPSSAALGVPFSLTATLYGDSRSIAQFKFHRDTPGGPIVSSLQEGHSWNSGPGSPSYLFPGTTADSLPSWFTGLSLTTTVSSNWNIPVLTYSTSINVLPGTSDPSDQPVEIPVPEASSALVFAVLLGAAGFTRRFRRLKD